MQYVNNKPPPHHLPKQNMCNNFFLHILCAVYCKTVSKHEPVKRYTVKSFEKISRMGKACEQTSERGVGGVCVCVCLCIWER